MVLLGISATQSRWVIGHHFLRSRARYVFDLWWVSTLISKEYADWNWISCLGVNLNLILFVEKVEPILSYEFYFGLRLQQFLPTFRHLVFSFWFFYLRDIDPIFPLLQHFFQVVLDPMLDDPNSVVKLKFIWSTVSNRFWSSELCKRGFVTWSLFIRNQFWSNSVSILFNDKVY